MALSPIQVNKITIAMLLTNLQFPPTLLQNERLKEHIETQLEMQEQTLKSRLKRNEMTFFRVKSLEDDFVAWATKKDNELRHRIERSEKLREEVLEKVVKRCKLKDKVIAEKLQGVNSRRRASLKEARLKANRMNEDILSYQTNKFPVKLNTTMPEPNFQQDLSKSVMVPEDDLTQPAIASNVGNSSNINHSRVPNLSLGKNVSNMPQSTLFGQNLSFAKNISVAYKQELRESKKESTFQDKFREQQEEELRKKINRFVDINKRHRENLQKKEKQAIQQLGERLEKIEQSREKKREKMKPKKVPEELERQPKTKPKLKKSERLHSQTRVKERRVHDWFQTTRQRRVQMHQVKQMQDDEYLEKEKLRYLKTAWARKIASSAIQKKLFMERLSCA